MQRSTYKIPGAIVASLGLICSSAMVALPAVAASTTEAAIETSSSLVEYPLTLDALGADAKRFAEEQGIPVAQARAELLVQIAFNQLVENLQKQYPDTFATAAYRHSGEPSIIGFVGSVPVGAAALVKASGLEVTLRGDFRASENVATDMTNQALSGFVEITGAETASAGIDPETLLITIDYGDDGAVITNDTARIVEQRALSVQSTLTDLPEIRLLPAPNGQPAVIPQVMSGGAALGLGRDGGRVCTAGFTVRNTRGGTGLMTAAHCDNNLNYERRFELGFMGEATSVGTDAQWHSGDSVWNRFIYSADGGYQTRLATSTGLSAVGTPLCQYGDTGGQHCGSLGNVYERNVPAYFNGANHYGITCMTYGPTLGGDSGGPYYVGEQARGIHFGLISRNGGSRSCFTVISRIEGSTDLRVLLS